MILKHQRLASVVPNHWLQSACKQSPHPAMLQLLVVSLVFGQGYPNVTCENAHCSRWDNNPKECTKCIDDFLKQGTGCVHKKQVNCRTVFVGECHGCFQDSNTTQQQRRARKGLIAAPCPLEIAVSLATQNSHLLKETSVSTVLNKTSTAK